MKRKVLVFILILAILTPFTETGAFSYKEEFPKLANYYLQPHIPEEDYDDLAKNDLLIIDIDADTVNPELLSYLKAKNPDIKILMYIPSQSVNIEDLNPWAEHRIKNYEKVEAEDWWLLDSKKNIMVFDSSWPTILWVDPGKGWPDHLSSMVAEEIKTQPLWDGVFYDLVFANLSWLNGGDIDIDRDGQIDDSAEVNKYWQKSMDDLMELSRQKIGSKVIVNNTDIASNYEEYTNGVMYENFPAPWLGPNGWATVIDEYKNDLPGKNLEPNIYVINSNTDNENNPKDYKEMRYGLTSTLMGDGYYSFDYGDRSHNQTWWYDEYDVSLGKAETASYNISDKGSSKVELGLWRRDFENGIALVNSSSREQSYVFFHEEFDRINGSQDRSVNDGRKINWIKVPAKDGLVLLKRNTDITNNSFNNGGFVRVFDSLGKQKLNGFFSYKDAYPGNTQILISDIDHDGTNEVLVNGQAKISIYKKGNLLSEFMPYDGAFKGEISFAVSDLNGDNSKEIITGAGIGGGPHVRVFDIQGNPLIAGFFAYDKNFRGGVNVAVMDLNGDGTKEIITGAGVGGGPHVRVFTKDGEALTGGFFAYNEDMRGGVSVAVGDVNRDGQKEIVTGPGKGSDALVKVFSKDGEILKEFLAYESGIKKGINVMSDDLDNNGYSEILVSLKEE